MDDKKFKFDVVIGNPPYQDETIGNSTSKPPIYHKFIDASQKISNIVELIHPARFLFNAGDTPKKWNEKMLSDTHLKVLYYEQDPNKVFPGVPLTGGVAVTYFDISKSYDPIAQFIPWKQLNNIIHKIKRDDYIPITKIIYVQSKFNLDNVYKDYPGVRKIVGSNGKDKRIRANAFGKYTFFSDIEEKNNYRIIGLEQKDRVYKYIKKIYVENVNWLESYKLFVPESNGASGMLMDGEQARIISRPVIGYPNDGCTQTFIVLGNLKTEEEAIALKKYVLSKFTRVLLGSLKVTQRNNSKTWNNVPLQDFTNNSDIDWSKSIPEIDQQLYKKYDLSEDEINFIESHVKEMD